MIALDDNIDDHPKFAGLSNDAFALWIRGVGYCRRNLTDGFIPEPAAIARARSRDPKKTIAELLAKQPGCAHPLWLKVVGGYQVHDYLEWNPSREDVEAKMAANREKGRKGGLRSGSKRSKTEAGCLPFGSSQPQAGCLPLASTKPEANSPPLLEPKRTPIRSDPIRKLASLQSDLSECGQPPHIDTPLTPLARAILDELSSTPRTAHLATAECAAELAGQAPDLPAETIVAAMRTCLEKSKAGADRLRKVLGSFIARAGVFEGAAAQPATSANDWTKDPLVEEQKARARKELHGF